ncbi:hypothetical protein [Candidatus Erwinia haradaeae]|uniref:hypothetical protein n=1 Tax=Candidatus Erwinia haradaeae TaxID=1922217 RepID=UPI00130092B7|nr:hypothetical protein [Candidatus Erwinia haradaeae]
MVVRCKNPSILRQLGGRTRDRGVVSRLMPVKDYNKCILKKQPLSAIRFGQGE